MRRKEAERNDKYNGNNEKMKAERKRNK